MVERLFYTNPYLREIDAKIVEKKFKNKKYYIKLDRTIFYPHLMGGQPGDKGTINDIEVVEVFEEDKEIIHVTREDITSSSVTLSLDWKNRLDNMQQHTGQHLLSAVFYKLFSAETIGFHIGKEYVYIDLNIPDLSEDEANKAEIYANRIVFSNFEIKSYLVKNHDLKNLPLRKLPTVDEDIRIVEIDSIDYSPCSGTHLRHTGELGMVKIRKWEKYKGNIRLEFISGNRAFEDYSWMNRDLKNLSLLLTTKDKYVAEKVILLNEQKILLEKENRNLIDQVVAYKGRELLKDLFVEKSLPFIRKTFENIDFKEVKLISNHLVGISESIQVFGLKNNENCHFLVSSPKDYGKDLKEIYKNLALNYEIKGGGSPKSVQGECKLEDLEKVLDFFYNSLIE